MSDPTYDGLCGIPLPHGIRGGGYLRCSHEMGHGGDHSWKKYENQFHIGGGVRRSEFVARMYPVPENCCCVPIRTTEGEITEYVFEPGCPAHS